MECIKDTLLERQRRYEDCLRRDPPACQAVKALSVPPEDAVALVNSHVLAPAMGGFVRWILQQAVKSGKTRIYFLARDGYFPYHGTRLLCEQMNLPIACRYLSCSRYSLRMPLFHTNRKEALDLLCGRGMEVSLKRVLSRGGMTQEEKEAVEHRLNLPFSSETLLTPEQLTEIRKRLGECRLFLDCLERHSREALPAAAGYFRQEGLLEDVNDAIVDSGWIGSIQQALGRLLSLLGRKKGLEGYYWGLYDLPERAKKEAYHSYYFGPKGNLREKIWFNNSLFEAVYTAPHGMTLGYEKWENGYRPVYGAIGQGRKESARLLEGCLMPYLQNLLERMGKDYFLYGDLKTDRAMIRDLFRLFMGAPTREEAEYFGRIPFSDDVVDGEEGQIAPVLTQGQLRDHYVFSRWMVQKGLRKKPFRESAWYIGSVVRGGRHIRRHVRQYAFYQTLRHVRAARRFSKERREKT